MRSKQVLNENPATKFKKTIKDCGPDSMSSGEEDDEVEEI